MLIKKALKSFGVETLKLVTGCIEHAIALTIYGYAGIFFVMLYFQILNWSILIKRLVMSVLLLSDILQSYFFIVCSGVAKLCLWFPKF